MERRTDYKTALLIESVIHDNQAAGRQSVARRLAELGVPLEVAVRVLTRPVERRQHFDSPFLKRESS
jgi:hypothetical protein